MKSSEIFGLAVRILGLVFLYQGLRTLPIILVQFCSAFARWHVEEMFQLSAITAWPLLLGWWLIRKPFFLVQLSYPDFGTPSTPAAEVNHPASAATPH